MSESNHPIQNHASGLTPGERRVAQRLDALGRHEQGQAPAGLEDRIFSASRRQLPAPRPLNSPWIFSGKARFALAACLAVGAVGVWFAAQPSATSNATDSSGQVAVAELEAEVGFTLDALLASYSVNASSFEPGASDRAADSFWSSGDDPFDDLAEEISL